MDSVNSDEISFPRELKPRLLQILARGKSLLLLGPRQTGKTTIIQSVPHDWYLNFIRPDQRLRYESHPELLLKEVEYLAKKLQKIPLIVLDEIQLVPELLNAAQDLIDRKIAQFIFTGSSLRKLRRSQINLLPGRVISLYLTPLIWSEIKNLPFQDELGRDSDERLLRLLNFGSLPGIIKLAADSEKEEELQSYVYTYLEEEIRNEAHVRNIGSFHRFLELAAAESGNIVSLRKLSSDVEVSHSTISGYYQILEDCMVIHRVEPYLKTNTRRRLTKSPKFLFFDLGLRRVSAKESFPLIKSQQGPLFEHFIGLELIHRSLLHTASFQIHYWRDHNGQEIDWILASKNELIPIEVKWTDKPQENDAKHLKVFLEEYPEAKRAFVVCRTPRAYEICPNITALPWELLDEILSLENP
jgi:predicted AAA+ superfamily ATPase